MTFCEPLVSFNSAWYQVFIHWRRVRLHSQVMLANFGEDLLHRPVAVAGWDWMDALPGGEPDEV